MESTSSVLVAIGAVVPLAHFVYSLIRDFRRMRRDKPRVRVFATVRLRVGRLGAPQTMKCVCVANVSGRTVSVAEVRTGRARGMGIVPIDGGMPDIASGGVADFPLPMSDNVFAAPYSGEVFVELGTGEVFSATV